MQYVNSVPLPPTGPLPPRLPEALTALADADRDRVREGYEGARRPRGRRVLLAVVALAVVAVACATFLQA
jgi:hypothetical protein